MKIERLSAPTIKSLFVSQLQDKILSGEIPRAGGTDAGEPRGGKQRTRGTGRGGLFGNPAAQADVRL